MPKVQLKSNGQYVVTVDKGLADAMDLAGADVEWSVASRNKLELQITSRGDNE